MSDSQMSTAGNYRTNYRKLRNEVRRLKLSESQLVGFSGSELRGPSRVYDAKLQPHFHKSRTGTKNSKKPRSFMAAHFNSIVAALPEFEQKSWDESLKNRARRTKRTYSLY